MEGRVLKDINAPASYNYFYMIDALDGKKT